MARRACSRRELLDRWRGIEEEQEGDESSPWKQRQTRQAKEDWFSDVFDFLVNLPKESHIWCGCWDLMGPLLETFHSYFKDKHKDSPLKLIWKRVSQEMGQCTQCICHHHQAQETFNVEYETDTVDPLLKVLRCLDEERVTEHLKEINARIVRGEYDPECHSAEVVSLMFEVLMFPILLDDQSLVSEFQLFIEAIDNSHEVTLAGHQQYPGVYALLFLKSGRARAIGLRLAGCMGKLRRATDLEPLQPLLRKYIGILETEVLPSTMETSRPRVQLERITVWLGIKALLGFLEAAAFEEGMLERYPIFLSIVLNHVSDDTLEFSYAVTCLRVFFEMLGCKLWLKTTLSPSVMRNTLLGQCFHTRNEKSHKEIFDLFLPFLQSLEALQDGEHEKQRRHFLYFLLHQVTQSSNFSFLMRKNARKIALLIINRGYKMNPPCPPFECAHMWGPSLVNSLKDSSLHSSLRQPAFDLIQTIIVSDASALISLKLKSHSFLNIDVSSSADFNDDEDELPFSHDAEEKETSCWSEFSAQSKLTSRECKEWWCIPMLWFDVLVEVDPSTLPTSFSKAVVWGLSHFSMVEPNSNLEMSLSVRDWSSSYAREISACFGWDIPNGSDDGGDGKESRNSVKASSLCIPLIRTFKRFAAHNIIQIEQHELQKQWTWEPRMAESLILLLIDPNDSVRQADRIMLEHVSKTRGLTSGLQFLCSCASSLSAIFLGLRCALRQVQMDSILTNFHNLHHIFFVVRKLLKEVVASPQKSRTDSIKDPNFVKSLSEGGFLRQPCSEYIPVSPPEYSPNVVDIKSWDTFSYLLSAIMWPSILKCLVEGKELINSKSCQMTCVRLLETLPVIFERLSLSSSKRSGSAAILVPSVFDFKWFCDLADWGKSSLVVISRHWKQCMLSLLNFFKGLGGGTSIGTLYDIETIVSLDTVAIDELLEKVSHLSVSLSQEASSTVEGKMFKAKPLLSEPSYFVKKSSSLKVSLHEDKDVHAGCTRPVLTGRDEGKVIVLSDDETEKEASPDLVILSSKKSNRCIWDEKLLAPVTGKGILSDGYMEPVSVNFSRNVIEPFPSKKFSENTQLSSQKQDKDVPGYNLLSPKVSPVLGSTASFVHSKDIHTSKELNNVCKENDIVTSPKEANSLHDSSARPVFCGSSAQAFSTVTQTDLELEKEDAVIKELIRDDAGNPWERALESSRRPLSVLTKASVFAPKRKVIQLQMPMNNKAGYLNKMDMGVRRHKPPRLDDWYRPILEIDYFVTVGLSSASEDENTTSINLKEVPLCFQSLDHYVEIFRPLVLEEFKAQLHNSYIETSSDDMCCGNLSVLSVERIDDFHLVRGRPDDNDYAASRGCFENDLVLLTKEPLQTSVQHLHVLGKVERREKSNKNRSTILVIRFYLHNGSSRLNKVRRLLIERSKWYLNRVMSITPQLREFQALSSLQDIPMLPIILNPIYRSVSNTEARKLELGKLSQSMQRMLKSSFNDSQIHAISVAIGSHDSKTIELSLIQGPPGTGKTRTIVAIVSALLAVQALQKNGTSKMLNSSSRQTSTTCTNLKTHISQSAAIARAWQDAAFAKQLIKDAEKDSPGSAEHASRGRVLICAQSNAAVDELVSRINEGLYGNDGKMYKPYIVRVGNAKTVHPSSLPFFIDTLVEQRLAEDMMNKSDSKNDSADSSASLRAKLEKLVDNIRLFESKHAKLKDGDMNAKTSSDDGSSKEDDGQEISDAAIGAKLNILYAQKKALCGELGVAQAREKKISEESRFLKHKVRKSILREAEIVVSTLSGSGGDIYGVCTDSASSNRFGIFSEHSLFDVVVIDEAAQALEPATLIPLQLLKSNGTKCIMVGDPKQLPATVLSNVASKFLYECSMFERLQRAGHPVIMLTEQYRMHPEICRFPSLHFYENKLLNGSLMASKSAPFHEEDYLGPYMFFDIVDGREHHGKNHGSLSLYNESEAEAAVEILKVLKKRYPSDFASGRIGILTPYRSQLSFLRSRFSSAFGPNVTADIEFNTVDGFQGREVDILVLSTVRASDSTAKAPAIKSSGIGFVADVRRMNVALTRAKLSLWIFGNAKTLQTNLHWASLVQNAKERNLFLSVARPYESIFKKSLSSSKENPRSHTLDSHSGRPKQGDRVKDASGGHTRINAKEGHEVKTKHKGRDLETHTRHMRDNGLNRFEGRQNSTNSCLPIGGVPPQDHRHSKAMESTVTRRLLPNTEDEDKGSRKQKDNLASSVDTLKGKPMSNRVGSKTIQVDVQLGTDPPIKTLIKKAKGAQRSSELATSSNLSQSSSATLPSGAERSNEAKDSKSSNAEDAPKDLIATRKRQRDAVEALLPSALISSKKPETSLKSAPFKRPPSPTLPARGIFKPSRSSKR